MYSHIAGGDVVIIDGGEDFIDNDQHHFKMLGINFHLPRSKDGVITKGATLEDEAYNNFLTVDAVYKDLETDEYIFFFDAKKHISEEKIVPIKPLKPKEVLELAARQAASEFDSFTCDIPEKDIPNIRELSADKIRKIFNKILSRNINFRKFFDFLRKYGQSDYWFREIDETREYIHENGLSNYDIIMNNLEGIDKPNNKIGILKLVIICKGFVPCYDLTKSHPLIDFARRLKIKREKYLLLLNVIIAELQARSGLDLEVEPSRNISLLYLMTFSCVLHFCVNKTVQPEYPRPGIRLKILKYIASHSVLV